MWRIKKERVADLKKALVFYLYGNRNAGDMAICVGAIELLKSKGYAVTMVSRFSESEEEYFKSKQYIQEYYPDIEIYPGPFSFERHFSRTKKVVSYCKSYMKVLGVIKDNQTRKLVKEADVVFFNGGNLLRGATLPDYLRLIGLFYPIKLAKKMNKPLYCLPQSTAQISSIGKRLLNEYLKMFDKVYVREENSYLKLKKLFSNIPFELTTDVAFFSENTDLASKKLSDLGCSFDTDRKNVAIILRNSGIGDIGELDKGIVRKLNNLVESFMNKHLDYHYFLIVQTEKDRNISQTFMQKIGGNVNIEQIELHDPLLLREIYKKMSFTISMRLHAAILSLSALTPVFGIFSEKWGLKNSGIMESYNMPYYMIETNDMVSIDIDKVFQENVENNILSIIKRNRNKFDF